MTLEELRDEVCAPVQIGQRALGQSDADVIKMRVMLALRDAEQRGIERAIEACKKRAISARATYGLRESVGCSMCVDVCRALAQGGE